MPLTTPKIFCQADTSDIFVSIKEIRSQFPDAPVFAVGFSLGGYTLNKYVGQVDTGVYSQGTLLHVFRLLFCGQLWEAVSTLVRILAVF